MGKKCETKIHNLSRRDFLKSLPGAAASAIVLSSCGGTKTSTPDPDDQEPTILSPRAKSPNVFINQGGKPILVCVTGTNFEAMLAAGLTRLGGLSKLITANQDVLIKPNCNANEPYPGITSTDSLLSIIREVKKVTTGKVSVGDQGYVHSGVVYPSSGMDPKVEQEGATLLTLGDVYKVRQNHWSSSIPSFDVYRDVYDAPVIVNTCVIKRHHIANYSCAIKNNVGTIAGPSAELTRRYLHFESDNFMYTLAEIAGIINPELNIVDARTVLTVTGPGYYDGVLVDANKIVLCGDIVATDRYCAEILAAHDKDFTIDMALPTIGRAEYLGMGTMKLSDVEVVEITV